MKTLLLAAVAVVMLAGSAHADWRSANRKPTAADSARVAYAAQQRRLAAPPPSVHERTGQAVAGACLLGLGALRLKDAADISSANRKLPPNVDGESLGRPLLEAGLYFLAGAGVLSIRF